MDAIDRGKSSELKGFVSAGACRAPSRSLRRDRYDGAMRSAIISILFVAAGCVGEAPDGFEAPEDEVVTLAAAAPLVNGQAVTGLAATQGQELHFALDVPAGASALRFAIAGGTG